MASPKTTLPNDNKEEQDSAYNPGEQSYREGMGAGYTGAGIDQLESFANDPANHDSADAVRNAEEAPADGASGFYKPSPEGQKKSKVTAKSFFKRKGAIGALIGLVFGTGLGFSALLSPSLLIVHMKEIMVEKFDTQLTSMDARTNKLLSTKINGATTGLCGSVVTIKCKFSTMSDAQVKNFRDAGIDVEPAEPNAGTRTKPTGYKWKGETVTASKFASLSQADPEFKAALKKAYNPQYAGLAGKAWSKAASFLGISKKPPDLEGTTDEERMKKLNSVAKNGEANITTKVAADFEEPADENGNGGCNAQCAQGKADTFNATAGGIQEDGTSGNAGKKVSALLDGAPLEAGAAAIKLTGVVDYYCQAYGAINAVGYAAKTIRAVQLARYAIVFWNAADEIKATGGLKPATAAFLGSTLTQVTKDAKGNILSGAGTDSFGFKYAAYGDTTASTRSMNISNRFLAGGGFTGDLINFSNTVEGALGGRQTARNTCGVLANPIVGGVSLVAGVAALFVPGANVGLEVAKAAVGIVVGVGLSLLPALLSDMIAGTSTADISGEASVDAIAGGGGKILSDSVAGLNGNGLMNKADAAEYLSQNQKVAVSYGQADAVALSPFDPTNQYTFLGSIVSKILPIAGSINDGSTFISSFGSLLSTSFGSIMPKSSALTDQQYTDSVNVCQDQDAADAGYATDPFCNVVRGIPLRYLNKDPTQVVDELIASGDLTPDTQVPTQQYLDFISKCIDNTNSPGYNTTDTTGFDAQGAKDCIIDDSNANKYLNYLDTRVQSEMDGTDVADSGTASTSSDITDKKALAAKIVAKNKVTYLGNVQPKLEDIASGKTDPNALPCGININILRVIDTITDKYPIKISDINRNCTKSTANGASSTSSRHYAGNGSAIDIAVINGVATRGRDAIAISTINLILPVLAAAAVQGGHSSLGQSECGTTPALPKGVITFNDFCTHLHIDVQPSSDPNLDYVGK
ncbi:MAG: hypothetical protein JWO99_870 [Candidatus Saccharibacteria bacterium]|nr:hypothetical protein [Candidatus Saccharibacteria bacterium]